MFDINKGLKLKKLYIKNYKIFNNFEINFTDINDNPLPIVVVAGINGTGKTTLLEYIYKQEKNVIYLPINKNIEDTKKLILQYLYKMVWIEMSDVGESYQKVRNYINNIFKDLNLLVEFESRDVKENLFFRNKKGEKILIDEISTGEKTLLSKILYLYFKDIKDSLILIDEPELSLHPAWQNRVLKLYENFAKKNNCQIIIATHSPHIIGSAKAEWVRLLTKDGIIDNFSNTYGAQFSQILTDIMDVKDLRTPEINEKFFAIKEMIIDNKFNSEEFKERWKELEDILGKNYFDLKLLKLEIASRRKDVQNSKK